MNFCDHDDCFSAPTVNIVYGDGWLHLVLIVGKIKPVSHQRRCSAHAVEYVDQWIATGGAS